MRLFSQGEIRLPGEADVPLPKYVHHFQLLLK